MLRRLKDAAVGYSARASVVPEDTLLERPSGGAVVRRTWARRLATVIAFGLVAWFAVSLSRRSAGNADGAREAVAAGGAAVAAVADDAAGSDGRKLAQPEREYPPPPVKVSPWIQSALRDYLSSDERRQRRGFLVLNKAGIDGLPQVRYWLRRVRYEADVVESLVDEILRARFGADFVPPLATSDLRVSEFFHKKLVEAQQLARFGNYRKAHEIASALLALDSDSPLTWEIRRLERESRERVLAEKLEPRIDASSLIYEVGDEIEFTLRLINRTAATCRIELDDGHLGQLTLDIDRRTIDGGASVDRRLMTLRAGRSRRIELAPGEVWEQPVTVPDLDKDFAISGMVARIRLTGRFRPLRWGFDRGEDGNEPIALKNAEVWIVPPAQKRGLESPLDRLVGAMFFDRPEDFLVGGQLAVWAGSRDAELNERLVDVIVDQVGELDAARFRLARNFLIEATGESFKEPAEWKAWWSQLTRTSDAPTSDSSEVFGSRAPDEVDR